VNNVIASDDIIRRAKQESSSSCDITCIDLQWRGGVIERPTGGTGRQKG